MQQQPFAPAMPMPPASAPSADAFRMHKLQALAQQLEIRPDWVAKMRALENFGIVMICDDSGSMSTPVDAAAGGGASAANPYAPKQTRWTELCATASQVCELGSALSERGVVDVYFLNRPPLKGATGAAHLQAAFNFAPPQGFTPLTRALQQVLTDQREALRERKLLLIIATDGRPTDDRGNENIPGFLDALRALPQNCFVQIMACTDDDESVAYLNEADRDIARVDVTDDYRSERKEILAAQGANFHFTYGDYVVKAMLGPVDNSFDKLDQRAGGCCAIS